MNLSAIFQLRTKKFWWMDVIFYFVISLFVATLLCYGIFLIENSRQKQKISEKIEALKTVGTEDQIARENWVILYQKKISDFTNIFENHEFASNIFAFMQMETIPNVWFRQFGLDRKGGSVQLTGESDDLASLSRQVANFEKNEYVKNMGGITSSVGDGSKINFSFNLAMNPKIFDYISILSAVLETTPVSSSSSSSTEEQIIEGQPTTPQVSDQKLITAFHILLEPEVIGVINPQNHTIMLDVPYGTDVKNLNTSMVVSPNATVSPAQNVPQDFTNPISYIVKAQDGTTQNYVVTVRILPEVPVEVSESRTTTWIVVSIISLLVLIGLGVGGFIVWKKMKSKKSNI
jgi:hypothetical protein